MRKAVWVAAAALVAAGGLGILVGLRGVPYGASDARGLHLAIERSARPPHSADVLLIRGVPSSVIRSLRAAPDDDRRWSRAFAVRVAGTTARDGVVPPVLGSYSSSGGTVQFRPHFPFAAGQAYRVDVSELRDGSDSVIASLTFAVPADHVDRTTRVIGIYPAAALIPENVLRWYVEFSAPMEVGSALDHVALVEENGAVVTDAFLSAGSELWDPGRTRLTLLFEPGRVKRGVRSNLEMGRPLQAGQRYRIVIDSAWRDARGVPLVHGMTHSFGVGRPEYSSPRPERWTIRAPALATRDPLIVLFDRPLDRALALSSLGVEQSAGTLVEGAVSLARDGSEWQFTPASPWQAGNHLLRISSRIEDPQGNRLYRSFDDWRDAAVVESTRQDVLLRFSIAR